MRTRQLLTVTRLLITALLAPATADAAQPACGQVVTQSLTLEADLVCPDAPTPALVVGAAGITIDLGATRSAATSSSAAVSAWGSTTELGTTASRSATGPSAGSGGASCPHGRARHHRLGSGQRGRRELGGRLAGDIVPADEDGIHVLPSATSTRVVGNVVKSSKGR